MGLAATSQQPKVNNHPFSMNVIYKIYLEINSLSTRLVVYPWEYWQLPEDEGNFI